MRIQTKILVGVTAVALLGCSGLIDIQAVTDLSEIEDKASMYDVEVIMDAKDQLENGYLDGKVTPDDIAHFREEVDRATEDGDVTDQEEEALAIFADRLLEE